jgi:hypothetical protein
MERGIISPVLVLTIFLPLLAIAGSTAAAAVAFTHGDVALPGDYHWEAVQLDHDFEASRRAAARKVQMQSWRPDGSTCRLHLRMTGEGPATVTVHGARPKLDHSAALTRQTGGAYEEGCGRIPACLWHVGLQDGQGGWSFMQDAAGTLDGARLTARAADSG